MKKFFLFSLCLNTQFHCKANLLNHFRIYSKNLLKIDICYLIESTLYSCYNLNLIPELNQILLVCFFLGALYFFYPGEYVIGSALFLLTLFVLKRDLKHLNYINSESLVNPLVENEATNGGYENDAFANEVNKIDEKSNEKVNS